MDKGDCINTEVAQIVNTLLKIYVDTLRQQMDTRNITDLVFNLDLFTSTVLLTIEIENGWRQDKQKELIPIGDYTKMQEDLQQLFLKVIDEHNNAVVKGYFPSCREVEISLLYIRSLWICYNSITDEERDSFALLMLEIPSSRLRKEKRKDCIDGFNALIYPLLDGTVDAMREEGYPILETSIVSKKMKDMTDTFQERYAQVFEPSKGSLRYNKENKKNVDSDDYKEYFKVFLSNWGENKDDVG